MSLRLDWATHSAAEYARKNWHYSGCVPFGKTVKIGVWENEKFIGVVIYSHGTAKDLGTKYGLTQFQCCELTRIALKNGHQTTVSRIISISLKMLNKFSPKTKLVVSFADSDQGHHGGVYQASNWIYAGNVQQSKKYILNGKEITSRSYFQIYKTDRSFKDKCKIIDRKPKYRYLYALDNVIKKKIEKLRLPFPKRAGSKENVVSGFQSEEGGANPTPALHIDKTCS